MMPAFRRGGAQNGRGRGRQARGGGPRLPSAITDELGLPSQKKKDYSRPYDKEEKLAGKRPHSSGSTSGNAPNKKPSFQRRPQEEPVERPNKRPRVEVPLQPGKPASQAKVASADPSESPIDNSLSFLPHTGEGPRKKLAPTASTALSRMLAKQKGTKTVQEHVDESDDGEHMQDEVLGDSLRGPRQTPSSSKQKQGKSSNIDSEAPLDPSIMDSAFGSGRGKKAEKDEEQEIAWLEWKLGKKGAKKPTMEEGDESDGLDDLLNFADKVAFGKGSSSSTIKSKQTASAFDSEDEDMDGFSDMDDDMMDLGSEDEDLDGNGGHISLEEGDEDEDETDGDSEDDLGSEDDDLAQFWTDGEEDSDGDEELRRNTEINLRAEQPESTAPDISSPTPVMVSAPSTGKYIPPSLRKLQQAAAGPSDSAVAGPSTPSQAGQKSTEPVQKTEQQIKLERKIQGLLNKLSEANIESILGDVEALYREWSRNEVTTTLTDMIIRTISDRANLLDSFVILYASFVAALYKLKGADLGGHFLQTAVNRYLTTHAAVAALAPQSDDEGVSADDPGKQPLNILTLISELYNFQVVSCILVYDLIKGFIDDLGTSGPKGEFAVEGVLRVLRCSGPQLRSDDPTALKDIVTLVQDKVSGQDSKLSARAKFMIETLTNIKNNKVKNLPGGQGQVAAETTTKMKKFLGGLGRKRQVMAHEPLRVTLTDIRNASTKGKWWIVGAAWAGDPVRERERARQAALAEKAAKDKKASSLSNGKGSAVGEDEEDETDLIGLGTGQQEELLKLARKQGMNTDVRRQVFMVMMTSDDYIHACDRLAGLKFTEVQQREFIRVALHCLAIEPTYNPYYALLLSQLTTTSYSHRFTLQYALWDFLRDLGQDEVGGEGTRGDVRGTSGFALDESSSGSKSGKNAHQRVKRVGMGLGWVISQAGVDLTVFKPVDFTSLQPATKVFFKTVFVHLVLGLWTRSPGFALGKKQRARRAVNASGKDGLTEDEKETVEAIFIKTIAAGGMELAQGVRYLLNRDMGVVSSANADGSTGKKSAKAAAAMTTKRFERTLDDLEVDDEGYRGLVWEGLCAGERVLGKMM